MVPVATCVKEMRDQLKWLAGAEKTLQNMSSMGQDIPAIQEQIAKLKVPKREREREKERKRERDEQKYTHTHAHTSTH